MDIQTFLGLRRKYKTLKLMEHPNAKLNKHPKTIVLKELLNLNFNVHVKIINEKDILCRNPKEVIKLEI